MRTLCFLIAALASGVAFGQDSKKEPVPGSPEAKMREYFASFDTDADRSVTLEELKACAKKESGQNRIEKQNADPYLKFGSRRYPEYLAADADDDLQLLEAELEEYFEKRAANKRFRPGLSQADMDFLRTELFNPSGRVTVKHFDSDGDSEISRAEHKAGAPEEEVSDAFWKYFDKDMNGKLSVAECAIFAREIVTMGFEIAEEAYDFAGVYRRKGLSVIIEIVDHGTDGLSLRQKLEVLEANEDEAKVKGTLLDKELKPAAGHEPKESVIRFSEVAGPGAKGKAKLVVEGDTIQVKAGQFECRRITISEPGEISIYWYSKDCPGLLVKSERRSGSKLTASAELLEYNKPKD